MSNPTTSKISAKPYKCARCGAMSMQQTNHWGETYSYGRLNACPNCPPWAKYAEFGGSTTWLCQEKPPAGFDVAKPWKKVKV